MVDSTTPRANISRVRAYHERLGHRMQERRFMDAAFDTFVAARERYPIGRVRKHVCRHDEGFSDCRAVAIEG